VSENGWFGFDKVPDEEGTHLGRYEGCGLPTRVEVSDGGCSVNDADGVLDVESPLMMIGPRLLAIRLSSSDIDVDPSMMTGPSLEGFFLVVRLCGLWRSATPSFAMEWHVSVMIRWAQVDLFAVPGVESSSMGRVEGRGVSVMPRLTRDGAEEVLELAMVDTSVAVLSKEAEDLT